MPGTKAGGKKAAKTNRERFGETFYQRIGRKGGMNGCTGGFASRPELARIAGAKGGKKSKRGEKSLANTKIEPRRESIIALYNEGLSIPKIAKRLRVSPESLRRWAKNNIEGYGEIWEE